VLDWDKQISGLAFGNDPFRPIAVIGASLHHAGIRRGQLFA
jgi:hypothetical protein